MTENSRSSTDSKAAIKAEEPANPENIVPPKPNSPLPQKARDDSPTGEGNTVGKIIGQAPQAASPPHEANAVILPETQDEKGLWTQLRDYFDTAMAHSTAADAEERAALLEMTGQKEAAENLRNVAENSRQNVDKFRASDMAIGAAKRVYNIGVDTAEAVTKLQGNASALNAQARAAELEALGLNRAAEGLHNTGTTLAKNTEEFNLNSARKSYDNPMQKGGADVVDTATFVSLAGEIPALLKSVSSFFTLGNKAKTGTTQGMATATTNAAKQEAKVETQVAGETGSGARVQERAPVSAETTPKTKNVEKDPVDNKSTNKEGQNSNKAKTRGILLIWPPVISCKSGPSLLSPDYCQ
ncbi:hypothetical protein [Xenorhabdus santafensis]|uniref:hypothetical protein n=1 Tax=Xenorhabdus santafensis TaxID=2582833 RepID=UPI0029E7F818|nr:hypothetical protein [Xenorhabdus sp. 12]